MSEHKHFNSGCVFGRVAEEPKKDVSTDGRDYISFKVNVSGAKSGQVTAYCRLWTAERVTPFLSHFRKSPNSPLFLKGFFGQYRDDKNNFLSNFTIFQWEERDQVDPRAVFILRGRVDLPSDTTDGGQRMLFSVTREGQKPEEFELWAPGEKLLDRVEAGQVLEVKGYVRQAETEDEYGGSAGPIRAYVHNLKVLE